MQLCTYLIEAIKFNCIQPNQQQYDYVDSFGIGSIENGQLFYCDDIENYYVIIALL